METQSQELTLKVLHILPTLERRGAQMFASDLINGLNKIGLDQLLVILSPGKDEISFAGMPGTIIYLNSASGWGKVNELRFVIKSLQPDILYAHGGQPMKYSVLARGRSTKPAIVYRKIGLSRQWLGRLPFLRRHFQRLLLSGVDAIISLSPVLSEELQALFGVRKDKITIIPNAVNSARFILPKESRVRVRQELGIGSTQAVLLSVGALSWEKNHSSMLQAFRKVRERFPEALLLLAGEGGMRKALEQQVDSLGLRAAVRFLGTRADIPHLMAASDILLLTSLTEGIPAVLIEAGLAGISVVTWDVAGARDVVKDGLTGFVTPQGNEELLANKVMELLQNPERMGQVGQTARAHCLEHFDIDVCARKHMELFEGLLSKRSLSHA